MPPDWIARIFHKCPCVKCDEPMTIQDILAVGVSNDKGPGGDLHALAIAQCQSCGSIHHMTIARSLNEILEGVDWFYQWRFTDKNESGLINLTHGSGDSDSNAIPEFPLPTIPFNNSPTIRPSKRRDHPHSKITKREVQVFLNVLHRTSFKLSSLSWKKFLEKLRR